MGIPQAARARVRKNKAETVRAHNVGSSAAQFLGAKGSFESGRNASRSKAMGRVRFASFLSSLTVDQRENYRKG